jgi:diguanylate cyclase (GGDEF)-like protein
MGHNDTNLANHIEQLRLRVYRIIAPLGVLTVVVITLFDLATATVNPIDLALRIGVALIYLVMSLILWSSDTFGPLFERVLFSLVAVFFVGQFYTMLWDLAQSGESHRVSLFSHWIPMLYFLTYLIFEPHRGLRICLIAYAFLLFPGLFYLVNNWSMPSSGLIISLLGSNVIYIFALFAITRQTRHFMQTGLRAEALETVANTDHLTGLHNRRYLDQLLQSTHWRNRTGGQPVSLLIFDIDHFKRLNDECGHQIGDIVLHDLAGILREHTRPTDELVRWGGEEFIILSPNTDLHQAEQLAERLRLEVQRTRLSGRQITVSSGVSQWNPGETAEQMIFRADQALYDAKKQGRNRVVVANPASSSTS